MDQWAAGMGSEWRFWGAREIGADIMADVFISYKREDKGLVATMAQGLESSGLQVSWDQEIPGDANFHQWIEQHLNSAKVAIVCWSKNTMDVSRARWVINEAQEAMHQNKSLFSVVLEEGVRPPLAFRHLQITDLSAWRGDAQHPYWRSFVEQVTAVVEGRAPPVNTTRPPKGRPKLAPLLASVAASVVVVLGLGAASFAFRWPRQLYVAAPLAAPTLDLAPDVARVVELARADATAGEEASARGRVAEEEARRYQRRALNREQGYETMSYGDGSSYAGQPRPPGSVSLGVYQRPDRDEYAGNFGTDATTSWYRGPGVYTYGDEHDDGIQAHYGDFEGNRLTGRGAVYYSSLTAPHFARAREAGEAVWRAQASARYFGGVDDDHAHGRGVMTLDSGVQLIGEWRNGVLFGVGVELSPDGAVARAGNWVDGVFQTPN